MAPVRHVIIAQSNKETEMQKSKQKHLQQQVHKRPQKSSQQGRNYITGDVSGAVGTSAISNSTDLDTRHQFNGNDDYDQQTNRGATLKTHRATVTATGATYTGLPVENIRNCSKNNIGNNNITTRTTAEVQRKRQHSPEKRSPRTNSDKSGTDCDIHEIEAALNTENSPSTSQIFGATLAPKTAERNFELIKLALIQRLLNEPHTITRAAPNSLIKLTSPNNNPLLPTRVLNIAAHLANKPNTAVATAATATAALNTSPTPLVRHINAEQILLQRIQLLQHFLNVTGPAVNSLNKRLPIRSEQTSGSNIAAKQNLLKALMVYENRNQNMDREVVVNSTSLEDVAVSELSDNRAQSIQSLNSVETPTPDNSPSFEELQQRLETSNRNIQNIQEQQQQLLRLQTASKQHLSDRGLLSAMMNMFTKFTADMHSQAEDLSAERDRLRALKEDLLRRKPQS